MINDKRKSIDLHTKIQKLPFIERQYFLLKIESYKEEIEKETLEKQIKSQISQNEFDVLLHELKTIKIRERKIVFKTGSGDIESTINKKKSSLIIEILFLLVILITVIAFVINEYQII